MQACHLAPTSFGKLASCKEGRDPNFGSVGFNRLKPSGYFTYHRFNIQQFYGLPTPCIYVFCVDLRTISRWKQGTDVLILTARDKSDRNWYTNTAIIIIVIKLRHAVHLPIFLRMSVSSCQPQSTLCNHKSTHLPHDGCPTPPAVSSQRRKTKVFLRIVRNVEILLSWENPGHLA
jgi:hypothetical protein